MRDLVAIAASLVVLTACPADDAGGDTGAGPTSAASMDTSSGGTSTGSSGATTEPEESGSSSGEAGPPVINMVTWTQAAGCTMSTASDVTIVIDVSDPDTDPADLIFSGMATGCTGEIDAAEATIVCPQVSTYPAEINVEDPEGNSDSLDIDIMICMDGMAP